MTADDGGARPNGVPDGVPSHAFVMTFTAQPDHIDIYDHVNNAVWVQWVQDVAGAHWTARATVEQQATLIWLVSRHEIDYAAPLLAGEVATAYSWVDNPRGARFDRHILFVGPHGKPCVRALTTWAQVDRARGRAVRVTPDLVAQFGA